VGKNTMNGFLTELAPMFVLSLAIQHFFEIINPIINRVIKAFKFSTPEKEKCYKTVIFKSLSALIGIIICSIFGINLLAKLGLNNVPLCFDYIASGFIIGGGTEGFNSVLKLANNAKDKMKTK
jgi:hypothetical protein